MPRSYPTTKMCDGSLLARFEDRVRDSDVLISTTAKCGQTWLQTLLHHLKSRGHEPDLGGKSLPEVSPWLEIPGDSGIIPATDRESRLAFFEELGDPRIFKLHLVWDEIPRPAGSGAKIVTITRDPRDVPYSMFRHLQSLKIEGQPPDDFDAYFEQWFERGLFFQFVASFWPHRNDDDVLWLRYEDLHDDLGRETRRIVDFLGWPCSDADIERVLPLVSFAHMQSTERDVIFRSRTSIWAEGGRFFREGAVGKNRQRLSAPQRERILERARRELGQECTAFLLRQA